MKMVVHETMRKYLGSQTGFEQPNAAHEFNPIDVIDENIAAIHASRHDVIHRPYEMKSRSSSHYIQTIEGSI